MIKKQKISKDMERAEEHKADNNSEKKEKPLVEEERMAEEQNIPDSSGAGTDAEQQQPAAENMQTEEKVDYEALYKELYDKYLRLAAEYDNYRKRTMKEKAELLKYGSESVLKNLLPVIDDMERAMKNIESAQYMEAVKEGIRLINNKFLDFLSMNGVKEIEALEKDFNVDEHEAVSKIPAEDRKGKVVEVLQKGYWLYDKVIRHAKVVVGE